MDTEAKQYDVAVVGGGPGGYSAAIRTAQLGGRVVLFEKENLGGTCLNVGCIPTKYLLEKAALIEKIAQATESGIFRDAGFYSWQKIQAGKDTAVKRLVAGVEKLLKSYGVAVVRGRAAVKKAGAVETQDGTSYQVRSIILATGSRPSLPPIKGIGSHFVLDSTGALSMKRVPRRLAIIGGGVIGLEFASIYHAMGSDVTILEMLPSILANEDRELVQALETELKRRGIAIETGVRVEEIADGSGGCAVRYGAGGAMRELAADCLLAAAGRKPNLDGIDVVALGLALDTRGNIAVNEKQETSVPGIYAVGDAAGGYQLAHAAYAEAETAAENCMGGSRKVNLSVMPRCVYSLPQVASVGATEEQLIQQEIPYDKGTVPFAANGKAIASEEQAGFVKMLSEKETGRIIGVHILGGHATELISSAVTAMNDNATISELAKAIYPHPTLSELVKEAACSIHILLSRQQHTF